MLRFSEKNGLLKKGDVILVALSGGVDSVVLLDVLIEISEKMNLEIVAAHLNHSLRKSADRDEEFVKKLCEDFGIKLYVEKIDVEGIWRSVGGSLEDVARNVRYEFLRRVKGEIGADSIATAHHMDDLSETVLHRIVRGTGPKGLVAMKPRAGDIIRPLLSITRWEIERYANERGLDHVVDETNFDTRYTRNFIRHEIVPLLKKINPSFSEAVFRLSAITRSLFEFLDPILEKSYEKNRKVLKGRYEFPTGMNEFLITEVIRKASWELVGRIPEWRKIHDFMEGLSKTSHRVVFWEDFGVWKSFDSFIVGRLSPLNVESEVRIGELSLGEFVIRVEKGSGGDFHTFLDPNSLRFRRRREGDKIGGRKLKDVFIERRIPVYLREEYPVLDYRGRIIWIPGVYRDREFEGEGLSFTVVRSPLERR